MKLTTTTYNYNNHELEFVLCYKARPFAVLCSSFFPKPTSSFIDHHLVMELGIKMSEIGCKKFSFCGKNCGCWGKSRSLHSVFRMAECAATSTSKPRLWKISNTILTLMQLPAPWCLLSSVENVPTPHPPAQHHLELPEMTLLFLFQTQAQWCQILIF